MSLPGFTQQEIQHLLQRLDPQQQTAFQQMTQEQKLALLRQLRGRQFYRAFRPELDSVAHDPLDPAKRYHDGVFVETDRTNGTGTMFHVTGDIIAQSGMRYEEKENWAPGQSARLHRITPIGFVLEDDVDSDKISSVLRSLPTPTKQQGVNFWKRSSEPGAIEIIWTKEDGEPYGAGEGRRPCISDADYAPPPAKKSRSKANRKSKSKNDDEAAYFPSEDREDDEHLGEVDNETRQEDRETFARVIEELEELDDEVDEADDDKPYAPHESSSSLPYIAFQVAIAPIIESAPESLPPAIVALGARLEKLTRGHA
ncbi:unnamed protein product [Zymoseptoria tritici ST99CH_3D1]|nr:unnamed protein product [Zymoseptoria tritici ST99CH_3D1]